MYIKHCVKCGLAMKDEEMKCPFCGAIQPLETEETKMNERKRKAIKWEWTVGIVTGIIAAVIFASSFWSAVLIGVGAGFVFAFITMIAFDLYYANPDKKDEDDEEK